MFSALHCHCTVHLYTLLYPAHFFAAVCVSTQLSSGLAWTTAAASSPSETASDSSIAAMVPISSLASCFYRFSAATSRYKPTRSIVPQVGTINYSSVSKTVTLFLHTWINKQAFCFVILNGETFQIIALRLSTMTAVKRSYDNVEKSEEDKRLYRGLELNNGLKVGFYLIQPLDILSIQIYIIIAFIRYY